MTRVGFFFALIVALTSCRKDVPPEPPVTVFQPNNSRIYVINEGNFQFGNAGVSSFDLVNGTVVEDVFSAVNATALGDVGQSGIIHNNKLYIVVNNSGKIVIVDPQTFQLQQTITGFVSPRFVLPVSSSKFYVSDLYSDHISILNPITNQITGTISCAGWSEKMMLLNGKVYVTNVTKRFLYIINPTLDVVQDSIDVGLGASSLVEDVNGKLWVLASGSATQNETGQLHCIDPVNDSIVVTHIFSGIQHPMQLAISANRTTLFYINDDVYSMPITGSLPTSPLIPAGGRNWYSLDVHPTTGELFVGDAIDYVQRGRVYRFTSQGVEVSNGLCGVIPAAFIFPY